MELLLLPPLLLMVYWDFRSRSVLLWHLLLLAMLQAGVCIYNYGMLLTGWNVLINTVILLIMGLTVGVYAFFRFRGKQKPVGMGDVVFILILTPYFECRPFLYFLISSFLITLLAWTIGCMIRKESVGSIPLISGVGICYAGLLVYQFFAPLW